MGLTPTSWMDGSDAPERHMQTVCPQHGMIAAGPRELVLEMAGMHFGTDHNQTVVVVGEDFILEPAPVRCDLCGTPTEPPWWSHKIEPPLFELGDADGEWLACDACHACIITKDLKRLVIRSVRSAVEQAADMDRAIAAAAARERFEPLLQGLDDGVREGLG